jgi:hypothetical protein
MHHYLADLRWALFAGAGLTFRRTRIHFRSWLAWRSMPLLLGLALVAIFIWFAENIGTFSAVWLYPHQTSGWTMVRFAKLGAWFLLLIISYTLVAVVNGPRSLEPAVRRPSSRSPNQISREALPTGRSSRSIAETQASGVLDAKIQSPSRIWPARSRK